MGACQKMMILKTHMCKVMNCLPFVMDRHLQKIISGRTKNFLLSELLQVQALGQPIVCTWCLFQYCLVKVKLSQSVYIHDVKSAKYHLSGVMPYYLRAA